MSRTRLLLGLTATTALTLAVTLVAAPVASAANTPTHRDCAFVGGFDPDYLDLSMVNVSSSGSLTAPGDQVKLFASEAPGEGPSNDALSATVSSPGTNTETVSGTGFGTVTLGIPLLNPAPGKTYTIVWNANFDNSNPAAPTRNCPSTGTAIPTASNIGAGANPFIVTTSSGPNGSPYGGACIVPNLRGKPLKKARRATRTAGCKLKRKGHKKKGKVKKQNPAPGKTVPAGTKVKVKLK
jgi:hypothetical protein